MMKSNTLGIKSKHTEAASSLKDGVVLVTGGSRGIGRALVETLAAAEAKVVFSFASNHQAATELMASLGDSERVKAYQADVSDLSAMKELVAAAIDDFGRIDMLINNAGISSDKALMMMTDEDWKKVIDTNLTGTFNACRAVIVPMMKQKFGRIVNVSSISGLMGLPGQVNYAASKAGVLGVTRSLAREVAAYGITVNAVAPGYVETDMLSNLSEKKITELLNRIPMQRLGNVEEVASMVLYLLSKEAAYVTGQTFVVDGGLSLG